ncbi:MAG TPA: Gfo/Idh/MocA family oxidoreductase, partial [Chitinophagaceae bacterium]|nr:Gfo/Idh/MocA family oxidoreductase [Chitinophagaceae bacterium]
MSKQSSRRNFIQKIATGVAGAAFMPEVLNAAAAGREKLETIRRAKMGGPNDTLQIALIGVGGMGTADANTAITVPGIKLVAACDLYDGRLAEAKKNYGNDIYTTRDYKEILQRKDIDAVIVATPDHWHKDISVEAMNSGKAVYCEKPMVHDITEGNAVIEAQNRNKVVFQVGSQGLSSLGNEKAKELLAAGAIGKLNYAEGFWARNSPGGAWQYTIPPDGSDKTVDWKRFLNKYPD